MAGDPIFTPSAVVILGECGDEQATNRRGWGGKVKWCGNTERAETRKQADRQRRKKKPPQGRREHGRQQSCHSGSRSDSPRLASARVRRIIKLKLRCKTMQYWKVIETLKGEFSTGKNGQSNSPWPPGEPLVLTLCLERGVNTQTGSIAVATTLKSTLFGILSKSGSNFKWNRPRFSSR